MVENSNQTQDNATQQTPVQDQAQAGKPDQTGDLDLGQFKNPKDLLKSYKEIQGAFTKISQEKKEREKELNDLREQVNIMRLGAQAPVPRQFDKPIEQAIFEKPVEAISSIVQHENIKSRIAEVLEEEHLKNPNDFQERYAVVNMLSQNPQYVQLCRSGQGVKKLFEIADKFRDERTKVNARRALEGIFGEPLDDEAITRLKDTVVKRKPTNQQTNQAPLGHAYMPDISGSTRSGSEADNPNFDARIKENADKGDLDGTMKAIFAKVLAE